MLWFIAKSPPKPPELRSGVMGGDWTTEVLPLNVLLGAEIWSEEAVTGGHDLKGCISSLVPLLFASQPRKSDLGSMVEKKVITALGWAPGQSLAVLLPSKWTQPLCPLPYAIYSTAQGRCPALAVFGR